MRELCLEVVQQRVPEPQKRSLCLLRRGAGAVEALEHSVDDLALAHEREVLVGRHVDVAERDGREARKLVPRDSILGVGLFCCAVDLRVLPPLLSEVVPPRKLRVIDLLLFAPVWQQHGHDVLLPQQRVCDFADAVVGPEVFEREENHDDCRALDRLAHFDLLTLPRAHAALDVHPAVQAGLELDAAVQLADLGLVLAVDAPVVRQKDLGLQDLDHRHARVAPFRVALVAHHHPARPCDVVGSAQQTRVALEPPWRNRAVRLAPRARQHLADGSLGEDVDNADTVPFPARFRGLRLRLFAQRP
mmetsp:Transcript_8933/g.21136  ORF Transcript_8933/g.21136 Transcript_8933/m.21136 type:complete len:303 (-) Transcript_8933:178-1086(-)